MKIPCETITRLINLVDEVDPVFRTLRLDNGCVVASNRKFMAVEHIGAFEGIAHILLDDLTLEQCRTETQFSSTIEITANPALQFTVGKTTLGFTTPGNIGYFPPGATDFDRWREIVAPCAEPVPASKGNMVWDLAGVQQLVATSPSGIVTFETNIDVDRPCMMRDIATPDWVGFFLPTVHDGAYHAPASYPRWL